MSSFFYAAPSAPAAATTSAAQSCECGHELTISSLGLKSGSVRHPLAGSSGVAFSGSFSLFPAMRGGASVTSAHGLFLAAGRRSMTKGRTLRTYGQPHVASFSVGKSRTSSWSGMGGTAGTLWASIHLNRDCVDSRAMHRAVVASSPKTTSTPLANNDRPPRIAIVGGGIAGISAAKAIAERLRSTTSSSSTTAANIVIFEGDTASDGVHQTVNFATKDQPTWNAATAKNANCLVPGSAMHPMSQRGVLYDLFQDTIKEWCMLQLEKVHTWMDDDCSHDKVTPRRLNIDNFELCPPCFDIHLIKCVGPSASWDERMTFVTFVRHYLTTAVLSSKKDVEVRANYMVQLAKANRAAFLKFVDNQEDHTTAMVKTTAKGKGGSSSSSQEQLKSRIGYGSGFLSLKRTLADAQHALAEAHQYGEEAELLMPDQARQLEPRIANLNVAGVSELYGVHRFHDHTANCAAYVQEMMKTCQTMGVVYKNRTDGGGCIERIEKRSSNGAYVSDDGGAQRTTGGVQQPHQPVLSSSISVTKNEASLATNEEEDGGTTAPSFRIVTKDGSAHEFDYVILAAGVNTPLLARSMGIGQYCPTYPMRGYSLTLYTNCTDEKAGKERTRNGMSSNLLNRPISLDNLFVSSVGTNMARLAGFGEFVGYRDKALDVPSVAPRVLHRYGRALFPDSNVSIDDASQCFRPMSPDDIPLVGEVSAVPGLFLHSGHGTLGWTMALATAECLAQSVCDKLNGVEEPSDTYVLPDDTTIPRRVLSPERFV